ncbi:MAG: diguanylate cyclase [Pseudomonadota bacterium]
MSILIVDDSEYSRALIQHILEKGGYTNVLTAKSAHEAFKILGVDAEVRDNSECSGQLVDLVLLDITMPEIDGIEACRTIKSVKLLEDLPVIMVTANADDDSLKQAFEVGAIDYVTKPINKVELLARVRSSLKLKHEMDRRMELARQLEEANRQLERLTLIDGLTGIANRRHFDEFLDEEWRRNMRDKKHISIIMADIDFFKDYNDTYGHQAGDDCLKNVAAVLGSIARRPGDLVARYGGEEFAIVLSGTDMKFAGMLAETMRTKIEEEKIPHLGSQVADHVTVSLGVASLFPECGTSASDLIKATDKALYQAKNEGRNQVRLSHEIKNLKLDKTEASFIRRSFWI